MPTQDRRSGKFGPGKGRAPTQGRRSGVPVVRKSDALRGLLAVSIFPGPIGVGLPIVLPPFIELMTWLKKFFGPNADEDVDYYQEGLDLLRAAKPHEALTSFRLALRETPNDTATMLQMAITYTRIGMIEEARKTYRLVLTTDPTDSAAHYGLAFLHLRDGDNEKAMEHLRAFLAAPPQEPEAVRHVTHARETFARLAAEAQERST